MEPQERADFSFPCARLLDFRNRTEQFIEADIDLTRRTNVTDFETVGLEAIFHQPSLLGTDHLLHLVRDDKSGGRCPDVAGVLKSEIAALVHMAARDQPQID